MYGSGQRQLSAIYLAPFDGGALSNRPRPETVKNALQGSGTLDWNNADDPDRNATNPDLTKEKLLNVSSY